MVIILKIFELKQSKLYKHYRLLNNKSKYKKGPSRKENANNSKQ